MKDVIIIGAGPAGLFASYEISTKSNLKVLVIDMGKDVEKRECPMEKLGYCVNCKPCNLLHGVGGSGGISDGTLNLRPDIGGNLFEYMNEKDAMDLVKYVDEIFLKHGAPDRLYKASSEEEEYWSRRAASAGVEFVQIPQRHIGSDNTRNVIKSIRDFLKKRGVEFLLEKKVEEIEKNAVILEDGTKIETKYILIAPGRPGANWLKRQADKLGIKYRYGPIDVGVRVEVPAVIMEPICRINHDPKFRMRTKTYDDFVRTFCVNHRGFVVKEKYGEFIGVNGYSMKNKFSNNTNFALLVNVTLTEPIENTTLYGESIARIATILGGGNPLIQRLGDLRKGRRSTWKRIKENLIKPTLFSVTPGDIAMVLPHRIVTDILESLDMLDKVIPGVASDSTLLYAPEIKYYAIKVEVDKYMKTNIENIFVAGDGAGVSRGLVIAAATGILAARGILKQEGIEC